MMFGRASSAFMASQPHSAQTLFDHPSWSNVTVPKHSPFSCIPLPVKLFSYFTVDALDLDPIEPVPASECVVRG